MFGIFLCLKVTLVGIVTEFWPTAHDISSICLVIISGYLHIMYNVVELIEFPVWSLSLLIITTITFKFYQGSNLDSSGRILIIKQICNAPLPSMWIAKLFITTYINISNNIRVTHLCHISMFVLFFITVFRSYVKISRLVYWVNLRKKWHNCNYIL